MDAQTEIGIISTHLQHLDQATSRTICYVQYYRDEFVSNRESRDEFIEASRALIHCIHFVGKLRNTEQTIERMDIESARFAMESLCADATKVFDETQKYVDFLTSRFGNDEED